MIYYALNVKRTRDGLKVPYLAGVFATREALDAFVTTVPEPLRADLTVRRDDAVELPCFMIERTRELSFVALEGVADAILSMADGRFGNLYRLDAAWSPPKPGTDYMGIIPHVHVTVDDVDLVRRGGVRVLLERSFAAFRSDGR